MAIHFLSTRRHDYTMRRHLDGPATALAGRIRLVGDEEVRDWCVRFGRPGLWKEAHLRWEADFLARNPHADTLRPIFDRAGIAFGRIVYGLRDGRIQVWEINSNPSFSGPSTRMAERAVTNRMVNDRIERALRALAPEAA